MKLTHTILALAIASAANAQLGSLPPCAVFTFTPTPPRTMNQETILLLTIEFSKAVLPMLSPLAVALMSLASVTTRAS